MRFGSRRSVFVCGTIGLAIAFGLLSTGSGPSGRGQVRGDEDSSKFTLLVEQLDHPAFQTRRNARLQLIAAATRQTDVVAAQVDAALTRGLSHRSVELRLGAMETKRMIEHVRRDLETQRLLNPHSEASTIRLAGWEPFSRLAGDDMAARRMFAALYSRYPDELAVLDAKKPARRLRQFASKLDPYHLPPEDVTAWMMLLLMELEDSTGSTASLKPRIAMVLSHSSMGPKSVTRRGAEVLRRLIDRWVQSQVGNCAIRDRLLIAMRYECRDTASQLCEQIFAAQSTSPSTEATALLCGLTLGRPDIESQAEDRLHDDRIAHVWQLIASRRTRIQTQVRDVALAVLLQSRGIDPRKVGFEELQADPTHIFREHSLGFPNAAARDQAISIAMRMLSPRSR